MTRSTWEQFLLAVLITGLAFSELEMVQLPPRAGPLWVLTIIQLLGCAVMFLSPRWFGGRLASSFILATDRQPLSFAFVLAGLLLLGVVGIRYSQRDLAGCLDIATILASLGLGYEHAYRIWLGTGEMGAHPPAANA